jgi:hypothetical protein
MVSVSGVGECDKWDSKPVLAPVALAIRRVRNDTPRLRRGIAEFVRPPKVELDAGTSGADAALRVTVAALNIVGKFDLKTWHAPGTAADRKHQSASTKHGRWAAQTHHATRHVRGVAA